MPNIAILVGNTTYQSLAPLDCCANDLVAMKELLEGTGKFETIKTIDNANSTDLKSQIRDVLGIYESASELFFYYTGHGYANDDDFFYCATNFCEKSPNETGLSNDDLHILLRSANADLVVKVVDACNSGTRLIKSSIGLTEQSHKGFNNFIQISSCLSTQMSLTGHPLSLFTEKFIEAALSKTSGIFQYMDLIAALRDRFPSSDGPIPFFVQQSTGHEEFVDDASKLNPLRQVIKLREEAITEQLDAEDTELTESTSIVDLLASVENRLATPERISSFVSIFFDKLKDELSKSDLKEYFDIDFDEHEKFREPTAERFIIEVLSSEKRRDNFVTAEISRERRRSNPLFGRAMTMAFSGLYDDEQFIEMYDLELNCHMARAQLRVTLNPKFSALQRILLVVTCAPSLETCYVFEVMTVHKLLDFGAFDSHGSNIIKRWYKFDWQESTDGVVSKITAKLDETVETHVNDAAKSVTAES